MTPTATPHRWLCIREQWGLVGAAIPTSRLSELPQKSAVKLRKFIRQASRPDGGPLTVTDFVELAHRAHCAGVTLLPVTLYTPRHGYRHFTLRT